MVNHYLSQCKVPTLAQLFYFVTSICGYHPVTHIAHWMRRWRKVLETYSDYLAITQVFTVLTPTEINLSKYGTTCIHILSVWYNYSNLNFDYMSVFYCQCTIVTVGIALQSVSCWYLIYVHDLSYMWPSNEVCVVALWSQRYLQCPRNVLPKFQPYAC